MSQASKKVDESRGMDGIETPAAVGGDDLSNALRFEDLTIDDDLPLLDRVVRYCRSGIALQRLVHVKMLAETAETVGYVHARSQPTTNFFLLSDCVIVSSERPSAPPLSPALATAGSRQNRRSRDVYSV